MTQKLLRPEVLNKLKGLDLKARLVVEGFMSGLHRSPFHGFSVEFADYRPYVPGDETKRIDWRIWGRTNRYYVKEFEEETNLKAYILLDTSGSMRFQTDRVSKHEYGQVLAASFAYLLLKQRDSVGLITFAERLIEYIPPSSKKGHIQILLKAIDQARPGGETDLAATFFQMAERMKRRGLIIVISDLLDEPSRVVRALKSFRYRKHEMLVFHVLDRQEWDFGFAGPARFVDLETAREITLDPRGLRATYRRKMDSFVKAYRRDLRASRIDYELLFTDVPYERALLSFLAKREHLP